ncbi:MAG TPA: LysR substrate-binding domain-containing protein [Ramlibacter sp.]|uniref:LysR family transcriptional regulator n=1 Tax=Ramlibacter sp. TaxID=1917967 RepID=UPI002C54B9B5|nr:LysR substrate-binding domain-containing protein [Ramlibacter sp.]HVZ42343.1 LysR substrate-binding domain-containing protein [Ramlibacter sp.]
MQMSSVAARLRLKHLELFRHVAEQQTLRRAAQLCHITQPAATKLIQEVEELFGGKLFVRDRRGMRLTAEGEVMRRHVGVLMADLERMGQELALVRAGGEGHIRLGVLPSLAPGLLTRSIDRMLQAHPRVRITIREAATNQLLDAVERNELDLTFARMQEKSRAVGVRIVKVYSEPFAVVIRRGHALDRRRTRRMWDDLSNASWVLPERGTPMRAMVDGLFTSHGALRPEAAVECTTLEKVADLVAGSDMVGVLPRSFARHGERGSKLVLLKDDILFAPTSLVTRAHEEHPPVMEEFIRKVQQAAEELGFG